MGLINRLNQNDAQNTARNWAAISIEQPFTTIQIDCLLLFSRTTYLIWILIDGYLYTRLIGCITFQ